MCVTNAMLAVLEGCGHRRVSDAETTATTTTAAITTAMNHHHYTRTLDLWAVLVVRLPVQVE